MLFFDFLLRHWFLSLVYIFLMANIVFRFIRQVVMKSRWYNGACYHLVRRWKTPELKSIGTILLFLIVLVPTTLVLYPIAPILWIVLGHLNAKEEWRREEKDRKDREVERAKRQEKEGENARRCEVRKQWLAENKPRLYCNTVSGVTAVLRPADYAYAQIETKRSRRNGFWEKDNILLLAPNTFVFVTKQGREMINANTRSNQTGRYKIAEWISTLDDIVEESGAEVIWEKGIFVPWVNEAIVPFDQQNNILRCVNTASYYHLIEAQAPAELQPL